jgi:hypothetical protein
VDAWCETQNRPRGNTLTLQKTWELSEAWYGNRLSPDYRGRTAEQIREVFDGVGLRDEFWRP